MAILSLLFSPVLWVRDAILFVKRKVKKGEEIEEYPDEVGILKTDPRYLRIKEKIDQFRILSDWDIEYCDRSKYKCQCCGVADKKKAAIYAWEPEKDEPDDFIDHELLHLSIAALRHSYDSEVYAVAREKEEELVQDICKIICNKKVI